MNGQGTPCQVWPLRLGTAVFVFLSNRQKAVGGIWAAIEDHVLDALAKFHRNIFIDRQLSGIDDAHIHASLNRVVQEDRVHGLADRLVPTKRKRYVRDAARDVAMGQGGFDLACGVDKIVGIIVMLVDASGDGEYIGVEDNILRRKPNLIDQQPV